MEIEMTDEEHTERATLQRRIKHQRAEIRRLNRYVITQNRMIRSYILENSVKRSDAYRHAAAIAETFWFGGRIAKRIRRWL